MDTTSPFITRKEAAQVCQRSERTLQRSWSRAIERQDVSVLSHLKLSTEDGTEHDGTTVTKKLIEDLKQQAQNPTWYVDAVWVKSKYGENENQPKPEKRTAPDDPQPTSEPTAPDGDVSRTYSVEYVELLRDQIEELKDDKSALRQQMMQYDRTLESNNKLQEQLHILLKEMQDRLLPAPQQSRPVGMTVVEANDVSEAAPSAPTKQPPVKKKSTKAKARSKSRRKKKAKPQPRFFSLETPTLRRIADHVSRRRL